MNKTSEAWTLPSRVTPVAQRLWDYLAPEAPRTRSDVVVGLGSSDISVATACADVLRQRRAPLIVFSGANSKDTAKFFPDGEAEHYARHALALGANPTQIMIERRATNTEENLRYSRELLESRNIDLKTALIATRPHHQLRALGTAKRVWPDVVVQCTSIRASFSEYLRIAGDAERVVNVMVGEIQRLEVYARKGLILADPVPAPVMAATRKLAHLGYHHRLLSGKKL